MFASDIILMNGLDDRRMSRGVLANAEELMADAVDAEEAYFSTCGSSLSVKSAMLAVAGPGEKLLVSRNAHKSVVAGLIISGVQPVWVHRGGTGGSTSRTRRDRRTCGTRSRNTRTPRGCC